MVEIATAGSPLFGISTIELERPGATYTVDTMSDLRRNIDSTTGIFFLIGWDNLRQLPQWKKPAELLEMCRLVAFARRGMREPDLKELEKKVPGIIQNTIIIDIPPIDISSSDIRERVAEGLSITDMVPEAIATYIKENRLYMRP
jgi:nicotinate-nucleotide adenylyltransferase